MFCDIANSTRLAVRVGAEAMHCQLNRFFDQALAALDHSKGIIN